MKYFLMTALMVFWMGAFGTVHADFSAIEDSAADVENVSMDASDITDGGGVEAAAETL